MNPCPVCHADCPAAFVEIERWSFRQCRQCAFVYLDPMPAQSDLNTLYVDDRKITSDYYPKARARRQRALLRALRLLLLVYGKRVLDVGCGGGFMADAFRLLGARATGIDVNPQAVRYAQQRFPRTTFCHTSFAAYQSSTPFDFVYSSEVLEHVGELDQFMALLLRVTQPGSLVYVTTPDIGSDQVPADITRWDVFSPPHHVQFFQEHNLDLLFRAHGFTAVKRFPDAKAGLKMLFRRDAQALRGRTAAT